MASVQVSRKSLALSYDGGDALFRGGATGVLVERSGAAASLQLARDDDGADVGHVSAWSKTTGGAQVEVARVAVSNRSASAGAGEIAMQVKAPAGSLSTTLLLDEKGSVVLGAGALATTATDGFVYVPTAPGEPTGVPTTHTGRAPVVVDTSANTMWFYSGGAWHEVGGVVDLSGYVPTSRVLTAGSGLTGLGDLTIDRTVSIATAGVTSAMLRDSAALSVVGRSANSVGVPGDIVGANDQFLRVRSSVLGFGSIVDSDLPSTIARTSALAVSAGQVAYGTGANTLGSSARLAWDNTNANLTLSGAAPADGRVRAGDGSSSAPAYAFGTATGLGFYKGGTTIVAVKGNMQFGDDGSGIILDPVGFRRVGFMKYGGREGGIWCTANQDFEIGQVDTTDLLTATAFNIRMRMSGAGRFKIGTDTSDARDALELTAGGLLAAAGATAITTGAGLSVSYGGGTGQIVAKSDWATSTYAALQFEGSLLRVRTGTTSVATRLDLDTAGALMLSNGSAGVSAASAGGLRYDQSVNKLQWAQNGGAWANLDAFATTASLSAYMPTTWTLTANGGLTGGGTGAANRTVSIATAGVTSAMLRDSAALSVIGRSASTAGVPGDIAAASNGHYLRRSADALGFGAIADGDLPSTIARTSAISLNSGHIAVGTGTGIAGTSSFRWASNILITVNGSAEISTLPGAGQIVHYNGDANPRWELNRDALGANLAGVAFGSGSTSVAAGGVGIGYAGVSTLGMYVSNTASLVQVARFDFPSARYRLLFPQATSHISFGAGTVGGPSSYDNWKLVLWDGGSVGTAYGMGVEGNNMWLHTGHGLKVYSAGTQLVQLTNAGSAVMQGTCVGLRLKRSDSTDLFDLDLEPATAASRRTIRLEARGGIGNIAGTPEIQIGTAGGASLFVADNAMAFKPSAGGGKAAFFGAGSFGGGNGVISIANRTSSPTSNPSGGGILYSDVGQPCWRDSDGNVFTGWN